jgi:very-short-patch-repair endonuclease
VFARYYSLFPKITGILSCWAVTSLSARGRVPFEPGFFDLLVIDEASQCDIASALPLLYRAKRAVIIGDPKQLKHISSLPVRQDRQLLAKHGLVEGFGGWAYSVNSLFDLSSGLCRSEDIVCLRDHHRSHADIISFSNQQFYEGRLRVATRYDRLRPTHRDQPAVRWLDVRGRVTRPSGGGALNEDEARMVVRELERLVLQQGYRGSIGVVSPFRAQANRIRDLVFQNNGLTERLSALEFLADTVHRFQGDERDVMIFSPVVSSGFPDGAGIFLRNNPNLFNVAITRARAALLVVGDRQAAANSGVEYLPRFAAYVGELGMREEQAHTSPSDFGPEYPVVARPELVSDWEKVLYRALYRAGLRPIPQYDIEQYILDFALFADRKRLDIEVDGERYHRNWDGELCRRDQIRNQRLIELGWHVKRFWVYEIRDDLQRCVDWIASWACTRTVAHSQSSVSGLSDGAVTRGEQESNPTQLGQIDRHPALPNQPGDDGYWTASHLPDDD